MNREPVTTMEELNSLDHDEIVEGYLDGFRGEFSCGDNRSKSYWHGYRNGQNDKSGKTDVASMKLAHKYVESLRAKKHAS